MQIENIRLNLNRDSCLLSRVSQVLTRRCFHHSVVHPTLCDSANFLCPWDLYRQECWSGLPFPSPGDLSDPGTEPTFPVSPALAGRFFTTEPPGILMVYFKEE